MTGIGSSSSAFAVAPLGFKVLRVGECTRALEVEASAASLKSGFRRQRSELQTEPAKEHAPLHYQLQVSKPLPSIDLSHTIADLCSPQWRSRIVAFMSSHYKYIAKIHRVASLLYFLLLILPPGGIRHAITFLVFFSVFTLTCTSLFLSLDILKMLLRTPDVLFVTLLNFINWSCLALMLGDVRAIVCFPSLYATQVGIFMDANFRTYPTVLRSIVASVPALLSVALCCALDKVYYPSLRVVYIAQRSISLANIIIYTSTTISIFMAKKAYHKYKESHTSFPGFHAIPCVVLRAKMKLAVFRPPTRQRENPGLLDANLMINPHLQRLRLSQSVTSRIDTSSCFVPQRLRTWNEGEIATPMSWKYAVPLHTMGLVGFAGLATQNLIYSLLDEPGLVGDIVSTISLVSTIVFCGIVAMHSQQDLVHRLLTNFDFLFASTQVIIGASCVADMNGWKGSAASRIFTWMVGFLWMLMLDAITPAMQQRLRLHRKLVLPVQFALLVNTAWTLADTFLTEDVSQKNRVLFQYQISAKQNYRLTTVSILVERLVTILAWCGSRIIADMVFADDDELLFLRGMVEYMSPFETFPPKAARVDAITPAPE